MNFREINLKVIEYFCRKRKISTAELASRLGITYVGLRKIIRENTTTVSTLIRIAEELGVPMQFFFMSEARWWASRTRPVLLLKCSGSM